MFLKFFRFYNKLINEKQKDLQDDTFNEKSHLIPNLNLLYNHYMDQYLITNSVYF